ncbi:hypothetical protein Q9233_010212 [Columba guinea]|nr:hypothetical protein Q9233_010212 [Columba guinea]
MALVTLQRSPTPSAASSASTSELEVGSDEERKLNVRSLGTSIIPPLLGLGPQLRDRLVVCPPSYPCSRNSHGNSMATATSKEVARRKIEDLALVSRDRGYRKNDVTLQWESQKCSLQFRPLVPNIA